jgi:ApbE superfamily uncharacterized protein (UPF0280 family)
MTGAVAAMLPGGRLHLQHGPIDLVIGAEGDRDAAFGAAAARFATVLEELVGELPVLRSEAGPLVQGAVARRMRAAVLPHASRGFVTSMAAVAGSVADEILAAMQASARLSRAYVNNGGDIALWLAPGRRYKAAIRGLDSEALGTVEIGAADGIGGIATSGQGGRSLSLGIAESVTVVAASAAAADAAAPLVANAVDLPGHPEVRRAPARDLDHDSDLGERPVVTGVGSLTAAEAEAALARGRATAAAMAEDGLIQAAYLCLRGRSAVAGAAVRVPIGA